MGSLTPGATYIYERDGDTVYAREHGQMERKVIGYHLPKQRDPLQYDLLQTQLWQDMMEAAKSNEALQIAIDRAILIYQTIREKDE